MKHVILQTIQKYNEYQRETVSIWYKFFDKRTCGTGLRNFMQKISRIFTRMKSWKK